MKVEWPRRISFPVFIPRPSAAMSDDRKPSKIYIPHTEDEGCNIVGILEQLDASGDTRGRPIALVKSSSHLLPGFVTKRTFASSSSTVAWGISGFSSHTERSLTCNKSQRLPLPEKVGTTTAYRFLPFRFPVNPSSPSYKPTLTQVTLKM